MNNFIGRYYHTLEQKGRVSIPKTFRNQLGEIAILTRGMDGCLFLFTKDTWDQITMDATVSPFTKKANRDWVRLMANSAVEVEFDRLGRINIPEYLKEQAKFSKEIVVVGSLDRIELWDQTTYHTYLTEIEAKAEDIAESLGDNQ